MTRTDRQKVASQWATSTFGVEQTTSLPQRGLRLLEEAIEAYQATGGPAELAHKLVDYVFSRPTGALIQELGGVGVTLLVLAEAAGLDADQCESDEVDRVLSKKADGFAARNEAKNSAGFALFRP